MSDSKVFNKLSKKVISDLSSEFGCNNYSDKEKITLELLYSKNILTKENSAYKLIDNFELYNGGKLIKLIHKIMLYGITFEEEINRMLKKKAIYDEIPEKIHVTLSIVDKESLFSNKYMFNKIGNKIKLSIISKADNGKNQGLGVIIPEEIYEKCWKHEEMKSEDGNKVNKRIPHITISYKADITEARNTGFMDVYEKISNPFDLYGYLSVAVRTYNIDSSNKMNKKYLYFNNTEKLNKIENSIEFFEISENIIKKI